MAFREHAVVVLTVDLPEHHLQTGDVGTVVYAPGQGDEYLVEFVTVTGRTIAVVPVREAQLRLASEDDAFHARPMRRAG